MDKQTAIASPRNDACFYRMEESWVTTTGLAEDNGEGRPALSGRAKEAAVGREIGAGTRPSDLTLGFSTILSWISRAGNCSSDSAQNLSEMKQMASMPARAIPDVVEQD